MLLILVKSLTDKSYVTAYNKIFLYQYNLHKKFLQNKFLIKFNKLQHFLCKKPVYKSCINKYKTAADTAIL